MPNNIDFDPRNSDLKIGIEIEYPIADDWDDVLVGRGNDSSSVHSNITSWPSVIGGRPTYDGTVGLEVVSDPLSLPDAKNWYAEVIEHVENEYGKPYQPVGLMDGGSTAGCHIHISSITESKARDLASISNEPWAQVLFCSSIAANSDGDVSWPVFRGGRYCNMNYGTNHYDVVNRRSSTHYEWRLVEPMSVEHMEILIEFLRVFEQDTEAAIQYAQERLNDVDDRITAVQRAEKIGVGMDDVPSVRREPAASDPENFYEVVDEAWSLPEIYTVEYGGNTFYTFDTIYSGEMEILDRDVDLTRPVHADSLERVNDSELADRIEQALARRGGSSRETEATEELKKMMKKKK